MTRTLVAVTVSAPTRFFGQSLSKSNGIGIGIISAAYHYVLRQSDFVWQDSEMTNKRLSFLKHMLSVYIAIIGGSTLVAMVRFSLGEDGSLHNFISTTSNHLVVARISASLLSWGKSRLVSMAISVDAVCCWIQIES